MRETFAECDIQDVADGICKREENDHKEPRQPRRVVPEKRERERERE